jgi:DNA polymerase-4
VDADAFYASVHLLEDSSLRGKPVVVAWDGPRSIVTTASYEARRYGIHSAQPASRARRLCPHAVFIRPNFELYRDYSRRAMAVVRSFTDVVEPLSLDEAYLDITALEHPVRAMRDMVEAIRAATGLTYSVGIGPNRLCAKVLSDHRKPAAFNVASREQCCELFAQSSPRIISGIGPKTVEALEALGLATVAQVRGAPVGALEGTFGERRACELRARCRFEHEGSVEASREIRSQSEETTFNEDVTDLDELDLRLRELAVDLAGRLQGRDLRGRTIGIKVRLADFTTVTRANTLAEPTNDAGTISDVAVRLLRAYDPPQPVRLLGVRLAGFEHEQAPGATAVKRYPGQLRLPIDEALVAEQ